MNFKKSVFLVNIQMSEKEIYNSLDIADRIKYRAGHQNVLLKEMLSDLALGSNTISNMRHGRTLASDSLARIADYLDCSVDYLLGRADNPQVNK